MAQHVLVTGGRGVLGRQVVPQLLARGHHVRVFSRHPGGGGFQGDVRTGAGLGDALEGIDTVVHAATNPRFRTRRTEVDGTRNVVAAARDAGAHLVYVSIVGVDQHRFPYYKAKYEAEEIVESSPARWTIQRATQFHDLIDMFLGYKVFPRTRNLSFQVVDAGEVATRLVDLVEAGPSGRAPDFGGPEVRGIRELAQARERITGRKARLVRVPRIGPIRDFDDGKHLCPDHRDGRITWEEWLESH